MKKVVVALGGNALEDSNGSSAENQLKIIKKAVVNIVDLIAEGYKVVVTHGNGPQVGRIVIQNEVAANIIPAMPFDVCGAMSQGMIGYHLQQALSFELLSRNIKKSVATIITQVIVDKNDVAFNNPSKPVGPFYTKEQKECLERTKGYIIKEDSNRGYRRVVASPKPLQIVELDTIESLIKENQLVVCCGGGGVPVIKNSDGSLEGIAAVIDKDWTSAKLAESINADTLIILTAVPEVYINYGKPEQKALYSISTKEAREYIKEGQFASGSMLPKIEAAIEFIRNNSKGTALITSLEKAKEALTKKTAGTLIVN